MKTILLAVAFISFSVIADDPILAEALAATGVTYAVRGDVQRAKDALYRALAYDENCAPALFELAKIADKEGDTALAGDLYTRAYGRLKDTSKNAYVESRVRVLNPAAIRLQAALSDYTNGVQAVAKKYVLTKYVVEAANTRLASFGLETEETPAEKKIFNPKNFNAVGKWSDDKTNKNGKALILGDNHAMTCPDGNSGTWSIDAAFLVLKFAKWHGTVRCRIIDEDTFCEEGKQPYFRINTPSRK